MLHIALTLIGVYTQIGFAFRATLPRGKYIHWKDSTYHWYLEKSWCVRVRRYLRHVVPSIALQCDFLTSQLLDARLTIDEETLTFHNNRLTGTIPSDISLLTALGMTSMLFIAWCLTCKCCSVYQFTHPFHRFHDVQTCWSYTKTVSQVLLVVLVSLMCASSLAIALMTSNAVCWREWTNMFARIL